MFTTRLVSIALVAIFAAWPAAAASRLAGEPSPYLQLHVSDPVDWWPWGEDALAEAQRTNRPIFLTIGYLACHWCHVMQEDNFKDPETAALMNELFVNIVVDREERPDIDALYIQAASLMELPTGWPLNMFLTPQGKPFYGGVYFPPEAEDGVPGFREIVRIVADTYRDDSANVAMFAFNVMNALQPGPAQAGEPPSRDELRKAWGAMLSLTDIFNGGFDEAPKYPRIPALTSLWRAWLRGGDEAYRNAVAAAAAAMADSGMYDHLGGGFARYTVDRQWRIPHFEKMLDINAQMIGLMTEVWRETRSPLMAARIEETIDYLFRETRLEGGAFGSALDADSEGEEGRFYVWTAQEIDRALGADAPLFRRAYGVTDDGNWEGASILYRDAATMEALAAEFGLKPDEIESRLAELRARLFAVRSQRERPAFDDKVVADWNAMAVTALAEAGAAFGREDWIDAALAARRFVETRLRDGDILRHYWRDGPKGMAATTADHAKLGLAALTLYEITGAPELLADARGHAEAAQSHWDGNNGGGYLQVAAGADAILPPMKAGYDEQAPSANAAMAELLSRLYFMTGEKAYRTRARATLAAFASDAREFPIDHGAMLSAADTLHSAVQVVVIGARGEAGTDRLLAEAWRTSVPGRVLQVIAPGAVLPDGHPAQYKEQVDGLATAYVCVGSFCSLPQTEPADFAHALKFVRVVDKD